MYLLFFVLFCFQDQDDYFFMLKHLDPESIEIDIVEQGYKIKDLDRRIKWFNLALNRTGDEQYSVYIAHQYLLTKQPDLAKKTVEHLLDHIDPKVRSGANVILGRIELPLSPQVSRTYFETALQDSEDPKRQISILTAISQSYLFEGNINEAQKYADLALFKVRKTGVSKGLVLNAIYDLKSEIEWQTNNLEEALDYTNKARQILLETEGLYGTPGGFLGARRALILAFLGRHDEAISEAEQTIAHASFQETMDVYVAAHIALAVAKKCNNEPFDQYQRTIEAYDGPGSKVIGQMWEHVKVKKCP